MAAPPILSDIAGPPEVRALPAETVPVPDGTTSDALAVTEPELFTDLSTATLETIIAGAAAMPVRRPVRGIQLKQETFARISVGSGEKKKGIYDSSGTGKNGEVTHVTSSMSANFLLQSVSIDMEEKFQPIQTFGLTYGFFFGERPHIYSFTAVLIDTDDFPWLIDWFHNYEEKLRGTKSTTDNTAVTVNVEEHQITGYITRCVLAKDAGNPLYAQLSFSMWVTSHTTPHREAGDTRVPYRAAKTVSQTPRMWDTTDAVRRENLRRLDKFRNTEPGWLRKTIQTISEFKNKYDSAVQSVENFLYNRNITTPTMALTEAEAAFGALFSTGPKAFRPPKLYDYNHSTGKNLFNQNRDEYMLASWIDTRQDYGSANPKDLVLDVKGRSVTMSAAELVDLSKRAYQDSFNAITYRLGVPQEQTNLLDTFGRAALATVATIGAQAVLQGDVVAFASGTVEGTILAPFGTVKDQEGNVVDQFSFKKDVLAPTLTGLYVVGTAATGTRTLSDSIISQVQKSQLERSSASRDRNERRRALKAASRVEERNSQLRAQQQATQAAAGASAQEAILAAAREEARVALEAQTARNQAAADAARVEQTRQLLQTFSQQAGT